MIREKEVFQTADGKFFDDASKAQEHVADNVREIIDARFADLMRAGKLTANDRYTIVMALIPDAKAATSLYRQLSHWIEYN